MPRLFLETWRWNSSGLFAYLGAISAVTKTQKESNFMNSHNLKINTLNKFYKFKIKNIYKPGRDECNWSERYRRWHHNPLQESYSNPNQAKYINIVIS